MNVYVLKCIYSQSQFTSYQGETASDSESIIAVYTSESLAKKRKEELEYENQDWVDAGECWYTVETWPITEELTKAAGSPNSNTSVFPEITNNLVIRCDTTSEALMLQSLAKQQGCEHLDAFGSIGEHENIFHFFRDADNNLSCCDVTNAGEKHFKIYSYLIVDFDKFFFDVSYEEMQAYGYDWEGMYGMTKERALALWDELDKPIYKLYGHDNSEAMVDDIEDIKSFDGLFGIEQDGFKAYVRELYDETKEKAKPLSM